VEVTRDATQAIELLYREHGARMWRGLYAFTGDPDVASDAVAEAFAQALRRGDALRDPKVWVWRAAFEIAKGDLRERRRVAPLEGEALGSYEMEEPDLVLLSALRKLGEKPRAAIVMHHASGYPIDEIAATLGVSSAAVKMHLLRARRRLRVLLEDADA
jgi:RNA polymerase sigma-70 factor (ECF subfamily)